MYIMTYKFTNIFSQLFYTCFTTASYTKMTLGNIYVSCLEPRLFKSNLRAGHYFCYLINRFFPKTNYKYLLFVSIDSTSDHMTGVIRISF